MEGYRRGWRKRGLPVSPATFGRGYQDHTGHEAMRKLLRTNPRRMASFCYTIRLPSGAMRAISEAGLRVPGHIAVVGAGNVHYSVFWRCPFRPSIKGAVRIGKRAADLLVDALLRSAGCSPESLIEPKLVIRNRRNGQLQTLKCYFRFRA